MLFFPEDYARLDSFSLTSEGSLPASVRGCGQALEIERPSGRVLLQIGGSAPALPDGCVHHGCVHHRFVGDPAPVGFCGRHAPSETGRTPNGDLRIALFDNATDCLEDFTPAPRPRWNHRSRVAEYRLSGDEAVFLRHHESLCRIDAGGSAPALENGNRLIARGRGRVEDRSPASVVEVDSSGREVL